MKHLTLILITLLLLSSCSFELEKRRYMKGYHVSFNSNSNRSVKKDSEAGKKHFSDNLNNRLESPAQYASEYPVPAATSDLTASADDQIYHFRVNPEARNVFEKKNVKSVQNTVKVPVEKPDENLSIIKESSGKKSESGNALAKLSGLLLLVGSVLFAPLVPRFRQQGYWAVNNRYLTRGILFALQSLIAVLGFSAGFLLAKSGYQTDSATVYGLTGLASALMLTYPHRKIKRGFFKNSYAKQKWFAFLLSMTGLMLFAQLGNSFSTKETSFPVSTGLPAVESYAADQVQAVPEEGISDSGRITLTVFIIIFCVLLCMAIAVLSCALACSGMGALAAILLVIGIPAVIIATVHGTKKLMEPVRKKRAAATQEKPQM